MNQIGKKTLQEIFEERKIKMLALEKEYNDLKAVLASIETKASATGVKSGSLLSEYASYKRKIRGAILAAEKKLADARFDLIKAKERLKGGDD